MLTTIFEFLNGFIVLFVGGTMMFSDFKPETFRKLCYLAAALIILPIGSIGLLNLMGTSYYWVSDLIFMRGGSIGIPVTFGYGLALGLLLNKLRMAVKGEKKEPSESPE